MECLKCNSRSEWYSDFNLKDYFPSSVKEGIISVFYCKKCDSLSFKVFVENTDGYLVLDSILAEESILLNK